MATATVDTAWSTFSGRTFTGGKFYIVGYNGAGVAECIGVDASGNVFLYVARGLALTPTDAWFTGATRLTQRAWGSG